jgi:hypothetical protein
MMLTLHLPRIIALLEENTRRVAEKSKEWRLEAELQTKKFIDPQLRLGQLKMEEKGH